MKKNYSNPFNIKLIEKDSFEISLEMGDWKVSKLVTERALKNLQEEINKVTGLTKISEVFNCNGDASQKIKNFWEDRRSRVLCNKCLFKWKVCFDCVIKCDSPLERDLLLEMEKQKLTVIMQRRINKDGSFYEFPKELDFHNLLTIPDFYLEKNETKLCIYADGHTYHERTEKQALRDKNIDRELQKLGYKVLRYTGKEIRSDCEQVVLNIKSHIE